VAIYDETMAPGYARWRTVHPQLLDALIAHSGVQPIAAFWSWDAAREITSAPFLKERAGASIHRLLCWLKRESAFFGAFTGSTRRLTAPVWRCAV
jgi:hypothetical protein